MFLLRLEKVQIRVYNVNHLHSNMFLLRRTYWYIRPLTSMHLHSNMFLLRLEPNKHVLVCGRTFTFQYVSIKTVFYPYLWYYIYNLHSNMFLLRRVLPSLTTLAWVHLHSNMFLLRLPDYIKTKHIEIHLHSNMFLLRPVLSIITIVPGVEFTFQYVSIKTFYLYTLIIIHIYLHSNMFLLRHNTSFDLYYLKKHLHSNMFLLRPKISKSEEV